MHPWIADTLTIHYMDIKLATSLRWMCQTNTHIPLRRHRTKDSQNLCQQGVSVSLSEKDVPMLCVFFKWLCACFAPCNLELHPLIWVTHSACLSMALTSSAECFLGVRAHTYTHIHAYTHTLSLTRSWRVTDTHLHTLVRTTHALHYAVIWASRTYRPPPQQWTCTSLQSRSPVATPSSWSECACIANIILFRWSQSLCVCMCVCACMCITLVARHRLETEFAPVQLFSSRE
jgi:hypothetical protein